MHISLTNQQVKWIQALIENCQYASRSEVKRHAIRLLQEDAEVQRVKLDALREAVQKGASEIELGEFSVKSIDCIIADAKKSTVGNRR